MTSFDYNNTEVCKHGGHMDFAWLMAHALDVENVSMWVTLRRPDPENTVSLHSSGSCILITSITTTVLKEPSEQTTLTCTYTA